MAETILTVTRFIPWKDLHSEPTAREYTIRLVKYPLCEVPMVVTPWACTNGRADMTAEDLIRAGGPSFATRDEAQTEANRRHPHFSAKHNQTIADRLLSSIEWQGSFMGPAVLADYVGVSTDDLYKLAHGTKKATRKQAEGALRYKGQRHYEPATA